MSTPTAKDVAQIIGAVGEIVGRTRLQKTVAMLEMTGLGCGFTFSYHRFGPYSEELTAAVERGVLLGWVSESEKVASWGGVYSVFRAPAVGATDPTKKAIISIAAKADSVVLELTATAAFLASEGDQSPWEHLVELKPEKASGENIAKARSLYGEFRAVNTPAPLPAIA